MIQNQLVYPSEPVEAATEAAQWLASTLVLAPSLTFEQWEAIGGTLATMERGVNWWVGDWLNFGEKRYGEKYAQVTEGSQWRLQSLMNMASVAGRIPPDARRPALSWTCHRLVAYLDAPERDRILDDAERGGWGSREVEDAVRALRNEVSKPKALPAIAPQRESADSVPARVDGDTPDIQPAVVVTAEAQEQDGDSPSLDLVGELERADEEIRALNALVESLQSTEEGKEIAKWALKYNQLEGRLRQAITEGNEAKKQARYQADILRKIREILRVESNSAILPVLMNKKAA